MKLEHLEYFCQIVPGYSLNALSEQIHISQQNLSTVIKLLESELSCKLLEKTGRSGVFFTKEGEAFYNATKTYLNAIQEIKFQAHQVTGKLTIAARHGLINEYFSPVIDRYMKQNPAVELEFKYSGSSIGNLNYLSNNEVELVLDNFLVNEDNSIYEYFQTILDKNDFEFIPYGQGVFAVQCHKHLFPYTDDSFHLKDLSAYPCIIYVHSPDLALIQETGEAHFFLEKCQCESPIIYECNKDLYYLRLLNTKCYGLSAINKETSKKPPHENLINLLPKDQHLTRYGLIKKRAALSPAAQRFVETLQHFYYI